MTLSYQLPEPRESFKLRILVGRLPMKAGRMRRRRVLVSAMSILRLISFASFAVAD